MKEAVFAGEIKRSCDYLGCFYNKIPDSGNAQRFSVKKPFDAWAVFDGTVIAMEFKMHKSSRAWAFDHVKEHQLDGLFHVSDSGGCGCVILNVRYKGYNRAFVIDVYRFTEECKHYCRELNRKSFPLSEIESLWAEIPRNKGNKEYPWDIKKLFQEIEYVSR